MGPDSENRVGDHDSGSPVGLFLLGCKYAVSRVKAVQEEGPLGDRHAALRFSFKMSFSCAR
jgi:hypothetical protein